MLSVIEESMLRHVGQLELFLFSNCNTANDRNVLRESLDNITRHIIFTVGNRIIKESNKNE